MTATLAARRGLLGSVPRFSMLTTRQAASVDDAVVKRRYRKGEAILSTMYSGDWVGETSLIDQASHSASVVAEVQTDTLVLDQQAVLRCLPGSDSMACTVLKGRASRLGQATNKIPGPRP